MRAEAAWNCAIRVLTTPLPNPGWQATKAAEARDFDQTVAYLATHADLYATLIEPITDAEFRETINMFGTPMSRGSFLVNLVLSGHVA